MGPNAHSTDWSLPDDEFDTAMGPASTREMDNATGDVQLDDAGPPAELVTGKASEEPHGGKIESTRERQVKPNKIYIGGLPENTRPEDLRNCFGKIGDIIAIELKLGYGFVEFDSREAAEESITRYNDGYFMGNKIRVEASHSRGRAYKRPDDPGACFRCGENGHWARECPNPSTQSDRRGGPAYDSSSQDRGYSNRDYSHHQPKDSHSYRDDYSRQANSRDDRYYETAPAAAPQARDQRRAMTPPRDRRDNAPSRREYDDSGARSPLPQAVPAASRYERSGHHNSERDYTSSRAQPHRDTYDRYDRRAPYSEDRNASYSQQGGRPRTPPGPPPAAREEYDKPSRGNHQGYEGRNRRAAAATTPPPPYPGSGANGSRSRRRSVSPPPRYDARYGGQTQPDNDRYGPAREGARVRDYHRSNRTEEYSHRRS